ncbi:MAG: recombinase family protein [Mycobacteriales bacterium]
MIQSAAKTTPEAMSGSAPGLEIAQPLPQAVSYLRVSSKRQLDTAIDVDPDGNSIATQREYCEAKAGTMGVELQREFVEPGTSGQTIEKRPIFRELLHYLGEHPDISFVIIYMRSRAFRNFTDAAITKRQLLKQGIRLISAKEDFGEGIMADAMEAVSDIMNEVQVRLSGEDIKTKMRHKAMNGGTLGRARLGYCNVRIEHEGRLINSIAVDEERAPLVRAAWDLYASGDYSLDRLQTAMADQGLTTRPSARWAAQAVSVNKLHQMLRDPYYTGVITYQGEIFPGRHPAIITQALFDRVQEVMNLRSKRGQRDRVHQHYLKGGLFCDRCRQAGRTSRLIFTEAIGRGGSYAYYLCRGRQDKFCDLPYLGAGQVEQKIAEHYALLQLPEDFATAVRSRLE